METEKLLRLIDNNNSFPDPEQIRGLSLGEITERYGTNGLFVRLMDTLKTKDLSDNELITDCLYLAIDSHKYDRRASGKASAVDHLTRTALHVLETLNIDDINIIAAAPMHDLLEDHPGFFDRFEPGERPKNNYYKRLYGKNELTIRTNSEVASIVETVSNPILEIGQDKQKSYVEHCTNLIMNYPKARIVKLADFIDNACGNHETPDEDKKRRLDERYIELYSLHIKGLFLPDSLIEGETREKVVKILQEGYKRACERMRQAGSVAIIGYNGDSPQMI